jgi:hypothetical protein
VTVVGSVSVERDYYYCSQCRAGFHNRDADLHIVGSRHTLAAKEIIAIAGTVQSFGPAAKKLLEKCSGLRESESTTQRITERVGQELGEKLDRGETFGPKLPWKWTTDKRGKTVAYLSVDMTSVPMQGKDAEKVDGRMATVGMIWNAKAGKKGGEASYRACLNEEGLDAMAIPLRALGGHVGMDQAQEWVAISDGGSGLESFLKSNFPRVKTVILDFYHASTYLHDWAKACHPQDAEKAKHAAGRWCHWLKHEGGAAVQSLMESFDVSQESVSFQAAHKVLLTYLKNQSHRMDYPQYLANGWQIGSGPVEAACKQVVNERLKGTGMRWRENGADGVCRLRSLLRSQASEWNSYWASLNESVKPHKAYQLN